jgi:O-antigen/teichoic acid export membrane protein
MSPTEAGIYFFAYAIATIGAAATRLGTELAGIRLSAQWYEARELDRLRASIDTRLMVVVVVAGVAGISGSLVAPEVVAHTSLGPGASSAVRLAAVAVVPLAILGFLSEILKGVGRALLALSLQNLVVPGVGASVLMCWARHGTDATTGLTALTIIASLAVTFAFLGWRRTLSQHFGYCPRTPRVQSTAAWEALKDAPALLVVSTTAVVMHWLGATLLAFFSVPREVAGYSVAVRLSIGVSVIHSAAASVVAPKMSVASASQDGSQLRQLSHETSVIITALTWPVLLLLFVFAEQAMSLFGTEYLAFTGILRILLVGQFVAAFFGHSTTVLLMAGRYAAARWTSLCAAMVLAVFSVVAVPRLGAAGAALAMTAALISGHVFAAVLARRSLGIWTVPLARVDVSRVTTSLIGGPHHGA